MLWVQFWLSLAEITLTSENPGTKDILFYLIYWDWRVIQIKLKNISGKSDYSENHEICTPLLASIKSFLAIDSFIVYILTIHAQIKAV